MAADELLPFLRDPALGRRNLSALAGHLGPGFADLGPRLARLLPAAADPDMALNNLERLFARPAARPHLPGLLADDGRGLGHLLQLLAASQFFADTLAAYPDALDGVRTPPRVNPSTAELTARLRADVDAATDDAGVLRAVRRFRHLQLLRIGANDVLRDRPLEEVTRELARVADACLEVALQTAVRAVGGKLGRPTGPDGGARLAALAFGKLGGDELNYSSDIDLMFVYDADGEVVGRRAGRTTNAEFFAQVVREVVRLLSHVTDAGLAYRVDLRLRPEGQRGPLARSVPATLSYYDAMGRTWERQALIKLRPVAGDLALGRAFVAAVEPFVYRKYFSFSEINEVKALKRRMEQGAARGGSDDTDVKAGRGGIRDIEYTVQFLQLLNGGDLPAVRQRNTLLALDALEIAGCLTAQETYILSDAYRFLRKTEHRLQLLFDWQTHKLPTAPDALRTLARRMGYGNSPASGGREPPDRPPAATTQPADPGAHAPRSPDSSSPLAPQKRSPLDELWPAAGGGRPHLPADPLDRFLKDFRDKTRLDRAILDHLLHQTFGDAGRQAEPESDLLLAPYPDDATVRGVLGRYPFRDPPAAFRNLSSLARESVPFLSHRRCRHFLASIAPQLLRAVADTADPDRTLNELERVTASLGGKAVLYELFSVSPATLRLYVDLCGGSPYLTGLLTGNPGMIDELLDSLVLDRPRAAAELRAELAELLRGASDLDPILHSFQDKELLRVGVRDLLGKDPVRDATAALSDLAETLLGAAFEVAGGPPPRAAVLGLGKLGGREIGYHSDLDLVVVYDGDGAAGRRVADVVQRVVKVVSHPGPLGRLYDIDLRLRPTGKSGTLVTSLAEFARYYAGGRGQVWERQALLRARVVCGDPGFVGHVQAAVRAAAVGPGWSPAVAAEVRAMRQRLEATASARSLKRGPGGLADVEFLVQLLQLKYGADRPEVVRPNVWDAVDALAAAGLLPPADAAAVRDGYSFLRHVEARLRLATDRPLTELPEPPADRAKLARLAGFPGEPEFAAELAEHTGAVRRVYRSAVEREAG